MTDTERTAIAIVGVVVLAQSIPEMAWFGSLFMSLRATPTIFGAIPLSEEVQMQHWNISAKAGGTVA